MAAGDKSKVRSRRAGDPEGRLMSDCSVGKKKKADRRLMKRSVITVCKLRRKDSTRLAFRSVEEERAERLSPFNALMLAKKKSGRETRPRQTL